MKTIACNARPFKSAAIDTTVLYALSVLGIIGTNVLIYKLWPLHVRQTVHYGFLFFSQGVVVFGAGLLSYCSTLRLRKTKPNHVRSMWRSFFMTAALVASLGAALWIIGAIVAHGSLPPSVLGALSEAVVIAPLGYRQLGFSHPAAKYPWRRISLMDSLVDSDGFRARRRQASDGA